MHVYLTYGQNGSLRDIDTSGGRRRALSERRSTTVLGFCTNLRYRENHQCSRIASSYITQEPTKHSDLNCYALLIQKYARRSFYQIFLYAPGQRCSHSVLKAPCRFRRYNTKDEENNESVPAVLNLPKRLP